MALIYERPDDNFDFPNSDSTRFNCGGLDNKMGQDEPAAVGECLGNDDRGSRRQRRARLRGTPVLEEGLSNERWQQIEDSPPRKKGLRMGTISLYTPLQVP